jgi:Uma2 family endonuclease
MATTTQRKTVGDLWALGEDSRMELIRGEFVPMSPAGNEHSNIGLRIGSALLAYADETGLGEAFGADAGFLLDREPDLVLSPDAAFVCAERLPSSGISKGFGEIVPDLVVEVISPSDRWSEVNRKVELYLVAGVRLVWLVDPDEKTVTVRTSDRLDFVKTLDDELDGGVVLPNFQLPVRKIFR